MQPDQKYIDALLNNDEKLLKELYQKCFPVIRNMVLENRGTETNAADIFQEALIELLRKAKTGQFVLSTSLIAYVKGICRNKWYDELKKQKRIKVTIGSFDQPNVGEESFYVLEEEHLKQARLGLIKNKFTEMGNRCKELLSLSWAKNATGKRRSSEELAAILNTTEGYVRKKKSECIVKLIRMVMNDPRYKNLKH